jgi:endosialidase-like protein
MKRLLILVAIAGALSVGLAREARATGEPSPWPATWACGAFPTSPAYCLKVTNSWTSGSGLWGVGTGATGYGVRGEATGASGVGVLGSATGATSFGLWGTSTYQGIHGEGGKYGVEGWTNSISETTAGVHGSSTGSAGVIGESNDNDGGRFVSRKNTRAAVAGINEYMGYAGWFGVPNGGVAVQGVLGAGKSGWAGYFEGPVYATTFVPSDLRLKKNVQNLPSQSAGIMSLRLVSWDWLDGHDAGKENVGVVAQEIQRVYPDVVREDPQTKTLTVNYVALVPRLLKLAQEQEARIAKLEAAVQP